MDISSGMIVAAVVIAALLFYSIRTFNRLVALRNRVRNAWSDIDVQLMRRHDLVPGLMEAVKGYLAHERGTLEAATEARSQAIAAGANLAARIPAETMLTGAIQRIAVTVERYPELRASQNMQLLQEQLTSTENRIAFARQFYNESVMRLNTVIATFPRNLIAGMMGVGPATLFVADEGTTDDRVIGNRGIENRKL